MISVAHTLCVCVCVDVCICAMNNKFKIPLFQVVYKVFYCVSSILQTFIYNFEACSTTKFFTLQRYTYQLGPVKQTLANRLQLRQTFTWLFSL